MRIQGILASISLVLLLALPQQEARADIAPPKMPPGTTLLPGREQTQVRMMAETVTLAVSKDPGNPLETLAKTDAVFTMRNLGTSEEKMSVRFPLTFFDGTSDGRDNYPEIPSIAAKVDGKRVPARREPQPPFSPQTFNPRPEIPWSVFEVAFPPGQDVTVEVTYTVSAYGYYPQAIFDYVLETGAAWNGPIGSVDIIVRLPYEASESNALIHASDRAGTSAPGGVVSGDEIHWRYADLEPTRADNFKVILVAPSLWESVLKDASAVQQNPKDGETWGMLAKGYKQAALLPKGWTRDDPAGQDLIRLSANAYQECLALLPKDPLWHYGYADLLFWHYYFDFHSALKPDTQGLLPTSLKELQTSLALDPNNSLAKDLLASIESAVPGSVQQKGDQYDFLALTATPMIPTPYPDLLTDTPEAATTATPAVTTLSVQPAQPTSPTPAARNPLCGGSFLVLALPGVALAWKRGRKPGTGRPRQVKARQSSDS
jgi:hypothetical protein